MQAPAELRSDEPLTWSPGRGTDVWAVFQACQNGNLGMLKQLIDHDPSLLRCHFDYRRPLDFAVRGNHYEVADYLLEKTPNPLETTFGDTLLEAANDRGFDLMAGLLADRMEERRIGSAQGEATGEMIRSGDVTGLESLLNRSPDLVYLPDLRGNSPIHWAVMTRQPKVIDLLLDRGCEINIRRCDGALPIQLTNGDYHFRGWRDVPRDHPIRPRDVLDYLRAHGASCDLCTASHIGDSEQVELILAADPTAANRADDYISYYPCSGTPLRNAAAAGHLAIVGRLLEAGADPNLPEEAIAPHGQALYAAATNRHYEIAKTLLQHGAHPNVTVESSGDTLSRVITNDDKQMLELLCSHGAAQDIDMLAYGNDTRTAAAVFAAAPEKANHPEALANAAAEGNHAFVELLLRYQPSLPKRLVFPSWALRGKATALTTRLFQHGYDPNRRNWLGIAPLHELAKQGNVEMAGVYLEHGAEIDQRDDDLQSRPIAWAAKAGQDDMVDFLLSRGASTSDSNDPPWATPFAWASKKGHAKIANRLRR